MLVVAGKGSYNKVEQVRYVGSGQGSYTQELVTTHDGYQIPGPQPVLCCSEMGHPLTILE